MHVRTLPSAPSLEYERKEAKALLKKVRAGDKDAWRRVRDAHPAAARERHPDELKLADVQHVLAREYGFTSWPRLVEYFEELERHRNAPRYNSSDDDPEHLEALAKATLHRHQRGDPLIARELARFVPRFYGRPIADIIGTSISLDEARLVAARERRRVSWEELVERAQASREWKHQRMWQGPGTPIEAARTAIRAHDVDALAALLDAHPELLQPSIPDREWRSTTAGLALTIERDAQNPEARRVTELLASHGVDMQRELNERLLGWTHNQNEVDALRWYLERGADPNWMPPNGIPVLEHAIVRYRNATCVDLIAERVTPRRALWIAAGLGDVAGVRSFIAGKELLTDEGRLNRPDLIAMGSVMWYPLRHDADDLEIMWEAFQIAGWNGRWAAMDALLEAGLPVDHAPIAWPLILEAVGNVMVPLTEYLVSRGANLDREVAGEGSPRAIARSRLKDNPNSPEVRRLASICAAGDPEEIAEEAARERPSPPPLEARVRHLMVLAADDAVRQRQTFVTTENMLVGLLRLHNNAFAELLQRAGTDMPKLRSMIGRRLLPETDVLVGYDPGVPSDEAAIAALQLAVAQADAAHAVVVGPLDVLCGILNQAASPVVGLLSEVGTDVPSLLEHLRAPR